MDDILSGGAIDPSTSGPIPPSEDSRSRDILLEQKEKQNQDAVGGTEFPPNTQPLPPIPEAPEVAPPLPVVPSFDFNASGSALEETREIARQTVVDILKNVTINGRGPSIDGSSISFDVPQNPPASEAFAFQGITIQQPLSITEPPQSISIEPPQQSDPAQEVQNVVVSPPTRQEPPQTDQTEPPKEIAPPAPVDTKIDETTDKPVVSDDSIDPVKTQGGNSLLPVMHRPPITIEELLNSIASTIPSNEPLTVKDIKSQLKEEGFQTTQQGWDNYIDPQKIKDFIGEKTNDRIKDETLIENLRETVTGEKDDEKTKDYYAGNTPFPPSVEFNVCWNGEPKRFLIPAFGPYPN